MPELLQYVTARGLSPYSEWFSKLDNTAAAKQNQDIQAAHAHWRDYKARKKSRH